VFENPFKVWTLKGFWKSINENMKTSAKENFRYYKSKQNKLWFEKEWSKLTV